VEWPHLCACRRNGRFQEQHPANATCPEDPGLDPASAPEPGTTFTPDIPAPERRRGPGRSRVDSASQQHDETAGENEDFDEIKWYLDNVQDPDDGDWRPTT
jgi:hypothetical protein